MDLHQLRIFSLIFRLRSFSQAAAALHLRQPTVSDHVKSLEEELGCRLFDRTGRTVLPTREAERLNGPVLEILEKVEALKREIGRHRGEISGELVIGASSIPGTYVLPPLITAFKRLHPAVQFQLLVSDSREIVKQVNGHRLLLGLVGTRYPDGRIRYIPFMEDELVAVCSPSLIKGMSLSLRDFLRYPMVQREEGSGTRQEMERLLEKGGLAGEKIPWAGVFDSTEGVKQAVRAGLGTAILSRLSVREELQYGKLKEIRLLDLEMKRKLYVIRHPRRTLPPVYTAFLKFLRSRPL